MGSETRARLGLAGLLLVTLMSFTQLFARGNWPGPVLLGMIAAGAIAVGARRLGLGTVVTFLVSACALLLYCSFIFGTRFTLYGLPTPDSIRHLFDAGARALNKADIDFAPVPVREGYVILTVVGLWVATTIGEIATFRWKRPLLACLPSVGLFSMLMVVGIDRRGELYVALLLTALLTYWGLESSHRLRSWGRWVPTWAGLAADEPQSVTGEIARRMGATCVVAAIVAPLFLPALGGGLFSWRNPTGSGPGGAGGGRIDPFVSIAPRLLEQSDTRLFTVASEEPQYWRLLTLPQFDGVTWAPESGNLQAPVEGRVEPLVPVGAEVTSGVVQRFAIEGLRGEAIPTPALPVAVQGDPERSDDFRYDSLTTDLKLLGGTEEGLTYSVTSVVPEFTYDQIVDAPVGRNLGELYTGLDDPLTDEVLALRDRWIEEAGAQSPYEQLVAIQEALRAPPFEYSTAPAQSDVADKASIDYLTEFLTQTQSGYCQQFATAFAVLARSKGYPTRIVVGFLPGEVSGEDPNKRIVRGRDAHAWPEVFFAGFGWVAFDPTPRAEGAATAAPPLYTRAELAGLGSDAAGGQDLRNIGRGAGELSAEERAELRVQADQRRQATQRLQTGRRERDDQWEETFAGVAVVAAVLLVAFLVAVPALKAMRIRRLYARARSPREIAAAAFEELVLEASELAVPRNAAETAGDYALRLTRRYQVPSASALRLATLYERAEYAPGELPETHAREARVLARQLRTKLWSGASWWDRGMRLFSPRALVAARRPG